MRTAAGDNINWTKQVCKYDLREGNKLHTDNVYFVLMMSVLLLKQVNWKMVVLAWKPNISLILSIGALTKFRTKRGFNNFRISWGCFCYVMIIWLNHQRIHHIQNHLFHQKFQIILPTNPTTPFNHLMNWKRKQKGLWRKKQDFMKPWVTWDHI